MKTKDKLAVLDGMRGIAAIFVLTRHTEEFWGFWLYKSYLAVDLFFVLSGFVIAHAYEGKLQAGTMSNAELALTRWVRLYPLYLLALGLCVVLAVRSLMFDAVPYASVPELATSLALAALFLPSFIPAHPALFPLNDPTWSLFFELGTNYVYVFVRRFLGERTLPKLIAASGLLLVFCSFKNNGLDGGFLWEMRSIVTGATRAVFGFLLGLYLYRNKQRMPVVTSQIATRWIPMLVLPVLLALPNLGKANWIYDLVCAVIVFPAFVVLGAQSAQGALQRTLLVLGTASYPIYVLQRPLGHVVLQLGPEPIKALAPFSGLVLVAVLVPLMVLLERHYDVPVRKRMYAAGAAWLQRRGLTAAPSEPGNSKLAA